MDSSKFDPMNIWKEHKWLIIMAVASFLFAVSVISYGFFKTIFLFICVAIGVYAGIWLDRRNKNRDGGGF